DLYLALRNRRPTATARFLKDVDSKMSFIADLSSVPDTNSGVEALIEFLMERARENGSMAVASWAFMAQVRVADILSKFTFDTRRVRYEMLADLSQTKVRGSPLNTQVRKCDHMNSLREFGAFNGRSGIRPLDMFELRDEISDEWRPRFLGFGDVSDGHLMVASRSNSKRKKGRIDLTHLATGFVKQKGLLSELIHDLVVNLYRDGVREVKLEIDAGTDLKQSLMDSGFEVKRTLMEMCLDILQD
ncbi:MAG: hypothetical protein ACFE8Z_04520, partial [Candidatus Hermodarchaeota archaeon]